MVITCLRRRRKKGYWTEVIVAWEEQDENMWEEQPWKQQGQWRRRGGASGTRARFSYSPWCKPWRTCSPWRTMGMQRSTCSLWRNPPWSRWVFERMLWSHGLQPIWPTSPLLLTNTGCSGTLSLDDSLTSCAKKLSFTHPSNLLGCLLIKTYSSLWNINHSSF